MLHTTILSGWPASPRSRRWWLLGFVALAGVLAVASAGILIARADTQPTITVAVKSGTDTQTTFTVTAANFPASAAITETFGDGTSIDPTSGTTDASGNFYRVWTLNATTKYCGTISAKTDTAQASTSFWVALTSDSQVGTTCGNGSTASGGAGGPGATATAAAQGTATAQAAAPTATAAPQPTAAPDTSSDTNTGIMGKVRSLLGRFPPLLLLGGVGLIIVVILVLIVLAISRRSGDPPQGGGMYGYGRQAPWDSPSARQRAHGNQQSYRQQAYGQRAAPPRYEPEHAPGSRTSSRIPGAGPRQRGRDDGPDQSWSRYQRAEQAPGNQSSGRMRNLREFTEGRQRAQRPGDSGWR